MRWGMGLVGVAAAAIDMAGAAHAQPASNDEAPAAASKPAQVQHLMVKGPDRAAIDAAFPKLAMKAGKSGGAKLRCGVGEAGALVGCKVLSEQPVGLGFGAAAMTLAPQSKLTFQDGRPAPPRDSVDVPFDFRYDAGAEEAAPRRGVTSELVRKVFPEKALRENVKGESVVVCRLDNEGATFNCRLESETPAGYGFGEAALQLAAAMRLNEHQPGALTIPITFDPTSSTWVKVGKLILKTDAPPPSTKPLAKRPPAAPHRSAGMLWLPVGFAILTALALAAALLWPARRRRRDLNPALNY